ncbi:MAG: autoinducer binding domain-containing protein [Burkholderiaceae bacterium]
MTSFSNRCRDTLHASTADDYLAALTSFAQDHDFSFVSAIVIIDHSPTLTQFSSITNVPKEYLDEFNDLECGSMDPVSQHCKRHSSPIFWNSQTYAENGHSEMWERQAAHGLKEGLSAAMHLPHGKHFFFGVDGDQCLKTKPALLKCMIADFQIYMTYAQAAAFEIVSGDASRNIDGNLSTRELDALKHIMDGRTTPEIAKRIGTSERTVELRLAKAMNNLGCTTRYQAVLRAIRLGYIAC